MITLMLVLYAFMAGMTAEYTHTKGKSMGMKKGLTIASLFSGIFWPWFMWGMVK